MTGLGSRFVAAAASIAASWLPIGAAVAGSFNVSPVRVELSAQERTQALTVRNDGSEPAVVQVRLFAWSQDAGQDVLQPTSDLLVSPPVFTVAPGQSQLLRIALRSSPAVDRQLSYRAILEQVPAQGRAGGPALQVALKISLPVFVEPPIEFAPELDWDARVDADGRLLVSARNGGNGHIQLAGFSLSAANGQPVAQQPQVSYILPGQTRSWTLDAQSSLEAVQRLRISGHSDAGDVATEIALAR
jgi:fimbrial chaperone protein